LSPFAPLCSISTKIFEAHRTNTIAIISFPKEEKKVEELVWKRGVFVAAAVSYFLFPRPIVLFVGWAPSQLWVQTLLLVVRG
jgi:hypothetical protein